jgi:lipopolysaccharide biosynthesis glycosyltransferase
MPSTAPERIDIALGFDEAYAAHAAAVIAGVARFSNGAPLRFIILHDGLDPKLRSDVESVSPSSTFCWCEVGDGDVPPFARRNHLTRASLFRLGLEKLAPEDCRRVIYLDSDVSVLGDVGELWRVHLGERPIGAVRNAFIDPSEFVRRWELAEGGAYFNSGVLLIDLEAVRRRNLFSRTISFFAENVERLEGADQMALNWQFWKDWAPLSVVWNVQRQCLLPGESALHDECVLGARRPAVVHYTGSQKPWRRGCYHPWSWLYWNSLSRTPFFAEVIKREGVSLLDRVRMFLRWVRRRPRGSPIFV